MNFDKIDRTINLYTLADKYLQEDLQEKCFHYLTYNINIDTVYKILDFAHQENILHIKNWCLKFFEDNLNLQNIAGLVDYLLEGQDDLQFKKNNKKFRNRVFNFIFEHSFEIFNNEKGDMKIYEDFMIKNIGMKTIAAFACYLGGFHELSENKKAIFEDWTANLKEAVFWLCQREC